MKEKIALNSLNFVEVREVINGEYHRRVITPLDDTSNETDSVKEFYEKKVTNKVKGDFTKDLEARLAKIEGAK